MVELCDLNMLPKTRHHGGSGDERGSGGGCYWPSYIDQHVAQLDFDTSMMIDEPAREDVFGSMMADASLISTDSLDMETLRARCENNKHNDYKLTFEDSGQWTTSGIGGSFTSASPPVSHSRKAFKLLGKEGSLLSTAFDNHNLSLRLLEELNNEDQTANGTKNDSHKWKDNFLDELLNNNNNNNCCSSQIGFIESVEGTTTWGRIRDRNEQIEPFNSEKVYSLPELNRKERVKELSTFATKGNSSPTVVQSRKDDGRTLVLPTPPPALKTSTSPAFSKRSPSLVVNFIDQRKQHEAFYDQQQQPTAPLDYEYSETFLGDGRYIDMNENEIGYIPPSTASIQRELDLNSRQRELLGAEFDERKARNPTTVSNNQNEQKIHGTPDVATRCRSKPRRTFADLSTSHTMPELKFIALSHKVPSICPSSNSLDNLLRRAKEGNNFDELMECFTNSDRIISDVDGSSDVPDSGLGSSHSEGPSHIEDWSSLSVLLPRTVVEACSFFKTNSFLLTGSSSNNIDGRRPPRSFTSAGLWRLKEEGSIGSPRLKRHSSACHVCLGFNGKCLDCGQQRAQSEEPPLTKSDSYQLVGQSLPRARAALTQKLRLHARELLTIGLPIYEQKRQLIERIVEGVAEIIRGASSVVLMTALERLIGDELLPGVRAWSVICKVTGPGQVTRNVYQLIQELEVSEKPEHSRVSHFFKGLLSMHSLDGWLSYIVLKDSALRQLYVSSSFLLGAHSTYRSLYWRLMEAVELLSVLNQCGGVGKHWQRRRMNSSRTDSSSNTAEWGSAAKLPSDSRVPKSSSMPTKLSKTANATDCETIAEEENNIVKLEDVELIEETAENIIRTPNSRSSKIPIYRGRSRSNNNSGFNDLRRERSSSSRKTPGPSIICPVRDTIKDDNAGNGGTMLPLTKGENVRVLSIRGEYTRCSRLQQHMDSLAIVNGIVPTNTLDLAGIGLNKMFK